jgi:hypothetical protein
VEEDKKNVLAGAAFCVLELLIRKIVVKNKLLIRKIAMKNIALIFALLLMLPGCLDNRPRMQAEGPSIRNEIPKPVSDALGSHHEAIKKDIAASQNAMQNNMQSLLGANIGKLSEDFLKLQLTLSSSIGDIRNNMSASLASNNELRAMVKAQMDVNAKLEADFRAMIKVNAELNAKVDALASAQVGVGNKVDSAVSEFKQSLTAGRDVNNSTVQFNKEMLRALESANEVATASIKQFAAVLLALISTAATIVGLVLRASRKRAELRAEQSKNEMLAAHGKLERAMAVLPPSDAAKVLAP